MNSHKEESFFFEKKNQKTFAHCGVAQPLLFRHPGAAQTLEQVRVAAAHRDLLDLIRSVVRSDSWGVPAVTVGTIRLCSLGVGGE